MKKYSAHQGSALLSVGRFQQCLSWWPLVVAGQYGRFERDLKEMMTWTGGKISVGAEFIFKQKHDTGQTECSRGHDIPRTVPSKIHLYIFLKAKRDMQIWWKIRRNSVAEKCTPWPRGLRNHQDNSWVNQILPLTSGYKKTQTQGNQLHTEVLGFLNKYCWF